jgi:hypothetical protein
MDDILVLAPTRWKLRNAVKVVNEVLGSLKLQKHPDKTYIGRVERGFDFLGYHFCPGRLTVTKKTVEHFVERARQLYEQERGRPSRDSQLGEYVRRWIRWCRAGLSGGSEFPFTRVGGSLSIWPRLILCIMHMENFVPVLYSSIAPTHLYPAPGALRRCPMPSV